MRQHDKEKLFLSLNRSKIVQKYTANLQICGKIPSAKRVTISSLVGFRRFSECNKKLKQLVTESSTNLNENMESLTMIDPFMEAHLLLLSFT